MINAITVCVRKEAARSKLWRRTSFQSFRLGNGHAPKLSKGEGTFNYDVRRARVLSKC